MAQRASPRANHSPAQQSTLAEAGGHSGMSAMDRWERIEAGIGPRQGVEPGEPATGSIARKDLGKRDHALFCGTIQSDQSEWIGALRGNRRVLACGYGVLVFECGWLAGELTPAGTISVAFRASGGDFIQVDFLELRRDPFFLSVDGILGAILHVSEPLDRTIAYFIQA
jgi:hypothetical protein